MVVRHIESGIFQHRTDACHVGFRPAAENLALRQVRHDRLQQRQREIACRSRPIPVFTDLQGVPENTFFHAVMSDVAEGLRLAPETLAALRLRPDPTGYEGRDFSHDLQRVIEELKTRTTKKVKLALLIDEVDVLNEYSERINQRLRSIFMKTFAKNLGLVMAGVQIGKSWDSEGSPWYNFFEEIPVKPFSAKEARELIRRPVQGIYSFEDAAIDRIIELSESKPYMIQKICIACVKSVIQLEALLA